MPLFKREAKISKVEPVKAEQPTGQAAQSPTPVPLPPPTEPKSPDETELESIKQRWAQALHDYAYGRFSDKTVVLNGKCYYKHKVLSTNQNPGLSSETWIGVNQDMAPVLVKVDYLYNAMGLLRVDVDEKPIGKDKAAEAGLTPEEVLKILNAMEKLEMSW
jgi:hypothetical protein